MLEIEVKIEIVNIDEMRQIILKNGFKSVSPYTFEHNTIYDTPDRQMKKKGCLIRLRKKHAENGEENCILTVKRPPSVPVPSSQYKSREEIESKISNPDAITALLQEMQLNVFFIYEKYREVFKGIDLPIIITLDHTPVGNYIEIEAAPGLIDQTAVKLGFTKNHYLTDTYFDLFLKHPKSKENRFMQF